MPRHAASSPAWEVSHYGATGQSSGFAQFELCEKITGVDYQPIAELVKHIPADTWNILQEIQKRHPAMMLDELLDKRERAPKQPPNAQTRKVS